MEENFSTKEYRLIKYFIHTIDNDIQVSLGEDFETDIEDYHIYLGKKIYTDMEKYHIKWIKNLKGCPISIPYLMLAILHEIGHLMTTTDFLENNREKLTQKYYKEYESGNITLEQYCNKYYEIPAELEATLWAIQYFIKNEKKCLKLLNNIQCADSRLKE